MLKLYNTLSRRKEEFIPVDSMHIKMYVCGPTVYDAAHIGNARPVVVFDLLFRLLNFLYPKVTYARNITDIDDKIIQASEAKNISMGQLTAQTTKQFQSDMASLGALPPTYEPKATDHIEHMTLMIQGLIDKGYAYISDGHVLFDVSKYKSYGRLSNKKIDEQESGARIDVQDYKRNPYDFVLWKPADKNSWESPFGKGRPGWHIECSAMAKEYLGTTFDIHAGGIDLVFPHHENEIAQSCCASNCEKMANYWMHNGHVTFNREKMSKSVGNIVHIKDELSKYDGAIIRFALLSSHYRHPLDWNEKLLQQTTQNIERFFNVLRDFNFNKNDIDVPEEIIEHLCDDLNFAAVLKDMHVFANDFFKTKNEDSAYKLFSSLTFLNLLPKIKGEIEDQEINILIEKRIKAKKEKDFKEADRIRALLLEKKIILEDKKDGTTVIKSM